MQTFEPFERSIHTVSFDAFGTLVRFDRPRRPFVQLLATLRALGVTVPDGARDRVMTRAWDLRACAQGLGATPSQMAALPWAALEADLAAEALGIRAFDDSLDVLHTLRSRGYRLAIVSNLALPYVAMVRRALPGVRVDVERWSCQVGAVKPDEAAFQGILRPGQTFDGMLHVGDTWQDDVIGAQRVGACPVFLQRETRASTVVIGNGSAETVRRVSTLRTLLDHLPGRTAQSC